MSSPVPDEWFPQSGGRFARSCVRSYCWLGASPRVLVNLQHFFEFLKIGNRLSLAFLTGGSASLRLPPTHVCYRAVTSLRKAMGRSTSCKGSIVVPVPRIVTSP